MKHLLNGEVNNLTAVDGAMTTLRPTTQQRLGTERRTDLLLLHGAPQLSKAVGVEVQGIQLLWLEAVLILAPLAVLGTCHPHLHQPHHCYCVVQTSNFRL